MTRQGRFIRHLEALGFTPHFRTSYWVKEYPERTLYAWLGNDGFCIDSESGTEIFFNNFVELEEAIIYETLREN